MTVSDPRNARLPLPDSDDAIRRAFSKANLGICLVDLEGRIFQANEKMCAIFGYARGELETMSVNDLSVPDDAHLSPRFMSGALAGDAEQKIFEKRYRHRGGHVIHARVASSLVRGADGEALYFISQVEDISERKRQEAELRQARDATEAANRALQAANVELARRREALEQEVLSRTRDLATARAEAESANAMKTRIVTNLSHEMRTPLQAILGYASLGLKRADALAPGQARKYFGALLQSGQRLNTLVESLLALADQAWRAHSGVAEEHVEDIDLHAFIAEVIVPMEPQADGRQQRLVLDSRTAVGSIAGDPARLRQVFEHLLGNALRYSPDGATITVSVTDTVLRASPGAEPVPAVAVRIIDEGCGIPASELQAVFEPFYESTRTASGAGGTGLGLALSRCVVLRHGGTIALSNRPEGGLVCEVVLPVRQPVR